MSTIICILYIYRKMTDINNWVWLVEQASISFEATSCIRRFVNTVFQPNFALQMYGKGWLKNTLCKSLHYLAHPDALTLYSGWLSRQNWHWNCSHFLHFSSPPNWRTLLRISLTSTFSMFGNSSINVIMFCARSQPLSSPSINAIRIRRYKRWRQPVKTKSPQTVILKTAVRSTRL